eukprot:TRINITY_DN11451_c0_g1_i2.p1 TRINITY_DN11451_c0_g1~~TRINITY_DN11451_c0_g1_i2.p1  ORF type:complete len:224 (+),score=35.93 TRINITY_DN11451_c0_g1_i2:86-757(+)
MKNSLRYQVVTVPVSSGTYDVESLERSASVNEPANPFILPPNGTPQFKQNKVDSVVDWISKVSKKADYFAQGVREHVRLAPNLCDTMIGKLSLGARILESGGVENVFRQNFNVGERELLLKVCQCYLSTTAGPIAGLLFIATENIAFHSERSIKLTSPSGVLIPLRRISRADPTENVVRPTEKYIHIVTEDNSEFWFMGFVSYRKAFKCLQGAISQCKVNHPR